MTPLEGLKIGRQRLLDDGWAQGADVREDRHCALTALSTLSDDRILHDSVRELNDALPGPKSFHPPAALTLSLIHI